MMPAFLRRLALRSPFEFTASQSTHSFCRSSAAQAMFGVVAGMALTPQAHQPGIQVSALCLQPCPLYACRHYVQCRHHDPCRVPTSMPPSLLASPIPLRTQLVQLWSASSSSLAGSRLLWALRRLGVCFAIVAAMKEGSKPVFMAVLPLLYRFFPLPIRRLWQPPVHNLAAAPAAAAAAAERSQPQQEEQQGRNGRQHAGSCSANEEASQDRHDGGRQTGVRTRRSAAAAAAAAAEAHQAGGSKQGGQTAAAASEQLKTLPPQDPRLAELPHDAQGRPWDVVVTARFFSYAAIGVAVAGVCPRVLNALGW